MMLLQNDNFTFFDNFGSTTIHIEIKDEKISKDKEE